MPSTFSRALCPSLGLIWRKVHLNLGPLFDSVVSLVLRSQTPHGRLCLRRSASLWGLAFRYVYGCLRCASAFKVSCCCWGWSWSLSPVQCHEPHCIVHQALLSIRSRPLNLFLTSTVYSEGIWFRSYLNGLVVFPTVFNLSLNLAIRSSWSEPQSAPGLVFFDCIELLHLWLQII